MKNQKLKGSILAMSGGSMALMASPDNNVLQWPVLLLLLFSLLLVVPGVIILIRADRKNINYYLLIFALAALFLALPFIKQ